MKVAVKVHPAIREFIVCTNGSDIIDARNSSKFRSLVRKYLTTKPRMLKLDVSENQLIYVRLSNTAGTKVYMEEERKEIYLNPKYRKYLSKEGQCVVSSELRARFKHTFHTFMYASLLANPEMLQKQAIILFIEQYKITLDHVNFEMLKKSWDRSDEKKHLATKKKEADKCPLLY